MANCSFCKPEYRKNDAYFENIFFYVTFDIHPVSPGHSIVIPKRHIVDLMDITLDEWKNLLQTIQNAIKIIETTDLRKVYAKFIEAHLTDNSILFCQEAIKHPRINTKPDAYNHGINDGKAAGRIIDHLHWHVIPRYENDVDDPRGGIRFVIPQKGNYKIPR